MRREQPVDQRLQAVGLADDHLRVFDQGRPVELALEKLRGTANSAQRILDFVRKATNQFAIRLLLLEEALLARDLELLIDVAKLEQQRRRIALDDRDGARKVQPRLGADAQFQLLLGVRSAGGERLVDRLE
jgi:hypothetical protein